MLWSLATSFLLLAVVLAAILSLFPAIRGHWMITALMLLAILLLFAMLFMSFDSKAAAGRSYTRPQGIDRYRSPTWPRFGGGRHAPALLDCDNLAGPAPECPGQALLAGWEIPPGLAGGAFTG